MTDDRAVHVLAGRLSAGWIVCEREVDPVNRARLEDHWIVLLRQYESACEQAARAQEEIAA